MKTLEDVLAEYRTEAGILRKNGAVALADAIDRLCADVATATEDFTVFLPESTAMIRTNRSAKWLRARFPEWLDQGHARMVNGERQYRALVLPRRANTHAAYEAGRRAGSEHAA
jgi:hypothetical protein